MIFRRQVFGRTRQEKGLRMKDNVVRSLKNGFFERLSRKKSGDDGAADTESATETAELDADAGDDAPVAVKLDNTDAHWPASIVGAFVGMLVGTLPESIWTLVFREPFSPLYLFVPLCVFCGIKILRGYMGRRGFILTVIFSLLGLYLTALSVQAVGDMLKLTMSVFYLPLVTIAMIGEKGVLPSPAFSSANVFPVVFTAIGAALAHELLMRNRQPAESLPEEDDETEPAAE
jgi:hypothetical protein